MTIKQLFSHWDDKDENHFCMFLACGGFGYLFGDIHWLAGLFFVILGLINIGLLFVHLLVETLSDNCQSRTTAFRREGDKFN